MKNMFPAGFTDKEPRKGVDVTRVSLVSTSMKSAVIAKVVKTNGEVSEIHVDTYYPHGVYREVFVKTWVDDPSTNYVGYSNGESRLRIGVALDYTDPYYSIV